MATKPYPIRMDAATLARLEKLAHEMSRRTSLKVSRAQVTRLALERGLELLERALPILEDQLRGQAAAQRARF